MSQNPSADTNTTALPPDELVERALARAAGTTSSGAVAIAESASSANLRWANNTLTTNGVMTSRTLTVVITDDRAEGTASGVVSRKVASASDVDDLVDDAVAAARAGDPSEDANELVSGPADADFAQAPVATGIEVFAGVAEALGDGFARAAARGQRLYGFVEHGIDTVYLGSSTGLRRRHVQPSGYLSTTGKTGDGTNSAWFGQATRDFSDVDATAAVAELDRRLGWGERRTDLPAGRYETILPPTSVADLMIYAYWTMSARDAHEGQTVYARTGGDGSGGRTRVGDTLSTQPVSLRSDPAAPGSPCIPFLAVGSSSSETSVFDNGLEVPATTWVDRGRLSALITSRFTAGLTGLANTPLADNLIVEVDGGSGATDDLVATTQRGLLFTSLWYIREVDPQTLLLTGLTRDGVYLVEDGEVTGAVNNFRFNESPVDLLGRFTQAGATVPAFSREWGEYFSRVQAPALRIPDFNCSSVSKAS